MNNFTYLIKNALEYYDINAMKYYDKSNTFKFYKLIKSERKILFYDGNKQKIAEYTYDAIGKYIPSKNLWSWAWATAELSKDLTKQSRQVLNYAFELDDEDLMLKTELITSRYKITSPIQLDFHVALTMFLSKKPFMYILNYFEETNKNQDELIKIITDGQPLISFFMLLSE